MTSTPVFSKSASSDSLLKITWLRSFAAQLLFLEAENPKKEIALYINFPGWCRNSRHGDL